MDRCKTPMTGTPIVRSDDEFRIERELPPFLTAAGIARDFIAMQLRRFNRPKLIDDAIVIVSEMVTNALEHAHAQGATYFVVFDWNGGLIRIEVWDPLHTRPELRPLNDDEEHGRGLHTIAALSEAWGSHVTENGKCVWAVLPQDPKPIIEWIEA